MYTLTTTIPSLPAAMKRRSIATKMVQHGATDLQASMASEEAEATPVKRIRPKKQAKRRIPSPIKIKTAPIVQVHVTVTQ